MGQQPSSVEPRVVRQGARAEGHRLQPSWSNPGGHRRRAEQLVPLVTGRDLLDVGCTSGSRRSDWVHASLAAVAASAVGVDIDPAGVARGRARGLDVRLADAEVLDLPELFDVVHAGELIEHLDNPRAFLAAARARLREDGRLVITTPNPFAVSNFVYRLVGRAKVNGDHTCWYCEDTLAQLLERNGFAVESVSYLRHASPGRWRRRLSSALRAALPERVAWNTLIAVARPATGPRSSGPPGADRPARG